MNTPSYARSPLRTRRRSEWHSAALRRTLSERSQTRPIIDSRYTPRGRCRSPLQETKILKDTDERDRYHPLPTPLEEQSDAASSVNKLLSEVRVVENGVLTVEYVEQEKPEGLVRRLFRRLAGRDSPMEK